MVAGPASARHDHVRCLRADGHAVDDVRSLAEAADALVDVDYDGLVVGPSVPDGDVLAFVAAQRRAGSLRPILVVGGPPGPDARREAVAAGADDHLAEPVVLEELVLRVRTVLMRGPHATAPAPPDERIGRATLRRARREVEIDGRPVTLSTLQYAIFDHLVTHRDRLVPAEELLEQCWDATEPPTGRPLPPQLTRLRKALRGALVIETVAGQGVRLKPAPPSGDDDLPTGG